MIATDPTADVSEEADRSREVIGRPYASLHEAYAVLLEEADELWDEIKVRESERDLAAVYLEAKQVAAVALRIMRELPR